MKLIIDGDIVAYKAGFAAEGQGNDYDTAILCAREYLCWIINEVEQYLKVQEVEIVVSGKENYRYNIAKTLPYKGNRQASKKPDHFQTVHDYLQTYWNAQRSVCIEADDLMGIMAMQDPSNTCIATIDKDLRMIPCLHYEMSERGVFEASDPGFVELDRSKREAKLFGVGYAWFCAQMLMGDRVDNVPGVPNMGPVKVYKVLEKHKTVEALYNKVIELYAEHGIIDRISEIAGLLWILRSYEDLKIIDGAEYEVK